MGNKSNQVAELLLQAGHAHHKAFIEVDGHDPDWPLWYAGFLQEPLQMLLGRVFTLSELVYILVDLDKRYAANKPDVMWYQYYAQFIIAELGDVHPGASEIL